MHSFTIAEQHRADCHESDAVRSNPSLILLISLVHRELFCGEGGKTGDWELFSCDLFNIDQS
jgi:hypothetical protein